jgi:hypothetical protein
MQEIRLSHNTKPTQAQMNKYLLATGLYTLNADGTWPRFAVQYFWETWCGMFALYCLKQSGVPGLR